MNSRYGISLVAFVGLLFIASAKAAFHVFQPPAAFDTLNGNSSFNLFGTPAPEYGRFQQVYSGSSLSLAIPTGVVKITELDFRVDAIVGFPFDVTIQNLQLNLSTTQRPPDGLSTIFDDNTGPDDKAVFGPGSRRVQGVGGGGDTSFNVVFDFQDNPFYYNPADGNLLLDFRIFADPEFVAPLDAFSVIGDSVSSVSAYGSSPPSSGSASSLGLATAFSVTNVPEPSTWTLSVLGIAFFSLWHWKKLNRRKRHVPH